MKRIAALVVLVALTGCKDKEKELKVTIDQPTLAPQQIQSVVSAWRKLKTLCPALAHRDITHVTGILEDENTMPGWSSMYPQYRKFLWVGDMLFNVERTLGDVNTDASSASAQKQQYNFMFGYGRQPAILYKESDVTALCGWENSVEQENGVWIKKL
ncbi:MAG: hypothetical protein ACRDDP_00990 [Plesiomonas sp.]|uniref:hypothetical protein n=1 Tax=Plesiomonas sp. TaxID=2486279 RepID=UPI003EE785B4